MKTKEIEQDSLARLAAAAVPCISIAPGDFPACTWLDRLPDLLRTERPAPSIADGAHAAAARILDR